MTLGVWALTGAAAGACLALLGGAQPAQVVLAGAATGTSVGMLAGQDNRSHGREDLLLWRLLLAVNLGYFSVASRPFGTVVDVVMLTVSAALAGLALLSFRRST